MRKSRKADLIHRVQATVRFSEVDSMQIAWHGSYVKYLEDGREGFGKHYGISYMDIYRSGYKAPIVDMRLQYKLPLTFGDVVTIETRYINCEAAKIQFDYIVYNAQGQVSATGSTIQVLMDENNRLVLNNPEFYLRWKEKWGLK